MIGTTSILPLMDLNEMALKMVHWSNANGVEGKNKVYGLVHMLGDEETLTQHMCDSWLRKQVNLFNTRFRNPFPDKPGKRFLISFGGCGVLAGGTQPESLDSVFSPEDVANLAYLVYTDAIEDGTFFKDEALVERYFQHTTDVIGLFQKLELI